MRIAPVHKSGFYGLYSVPNLLAFFLWSPLQAHHPRTLSDLLPGGNSTLSQFGRITPKSTESATTCTSSNTSVTADHAGTALVQFTTHVSELFQYLSVRVAHNLTRHSTKLFLVYELRPLDHYLIQLLLEPDNRLNDSYLLLFAQWPEGKQSFLILL